MKVTTIEQAFYDLTDPRGIRRPTYPLIWIITIAICAILCGCKDWEEVAMFGESKIAWFKDKLGYELDRTPCETVFSQFFRYLDPEEFASKFQDWVALILENAARRHIQLDGKVLVGSGNSKKDRQGLCLVSAFASEYGLSLVQKQTDCKSNEIPCMNEVLALLDIKDAVVSIDAAGCQIEIVDTIVSKGGEYVIALKGNQQGLHDEAQNYFQQALAADYDKVIHVQIKEKKHGREETRDVYVISGEELEWLPEKYKNRWKRLHAMACVRLRQKERKEAVRYFIASITDVKEIAHSVRAHWSIENTLHWVLDVAMKEDNNKTYIDHTPANFALLRKIVLNLLRMDKMKKLSIAKKQLQALMGDNYRFNLLQLFGQQLVAENSPDKILN